MVPSASNMSLFDDLPVPAETCENTEKANSTFEKEPLSTNASSVNEITDASGHKRKSGDLNECGEDTGRSDAKKFKEDTTDGSLIKLSSSAHGRKGERDEMQDHHILFNDLVIDLPASTIRHQVSRIAFYGVYDGHAGARASQYTANRLHKIILEKFPTGNKEKIEREMKKCFVDSFKATDEEFIKQASKQRPVWKDGTTATVVLIVDNTLYVANIGDSKAILCRESAEGTSNAITLTKDHNPTMHVERMRIQKAGGTVRDGRVNGVLEVSRSIGDGHFKRYGVTCVPDVRKCNLTDKDRYVLIACDGLWKSFSSEEVIEYIETIAKEEERKKKSNDCITAPLYEVICSKLSAEAVKRLSGDNVTVLLVQFKHSS